jgi:pilus assembly protein Flp/PilA
MSWGGGESMLLGLYARLQNGWVALRTKARDEGGATAVEYGLLVALIAAIIVIVVALLGQKVSGAFSSVESAIP